MGEPLQVESRTENDAEWHPCTLSLGENSVVFSRGASVIEVSDEMLDGIGYANQTLTLFLCGRPSVLVRGPASLAGIAAAVDARVRVMTEVTRSLRALGARRGRPGADHDRFFEPLLNARRKAEAKRDANGRIAEFASDHLIEALDGIISAFSSERFPDSPPERRAMTETLREKLQGLAAALRTMGVSAESARTAADQRKFAAWKAWLVTVDQVFREADRAWIDIVPMLEIMKPRKPGVLGKLLGRPPRKPESAR